MIYNISKTPAAATRFQGMDRFEIQVLLSDGSIADYEVMNDRNSNTFEVRNPDGKLAVFTAADDGSWEASENPGNINDDLQQRIINQLKGYKS